MDVFDWLVVSFIIFGIYGFVRFISKVYKKIFKRESKNQPTTTPISRRTERIGGITYRQEDYIYSLCDEIEIDFEQLDKLVLKRYQLQDLEDLSKEEASDLIDHLLGKREKYYEFD